MISPLQRHSDPARSELDELRRVLRCLKSAPARTRVAVGTGVSLANTDFLRQFGGIEPFRQSSPDERHQFFSRLGDLELASRTEELGLALGVGLYRIWLGEMLAGRRETAELLGEELTELSRRASDRRP